MRAGSARVRTASVMAVVGALSDSFIHRHRDGNIEPVLLHVASPSTVRQGAVLLHSSCKSERVCRSVRARPSLRACFAHQHNERAFWWSCAVRARPRTKGIDIVRIIRSHHVIIDVRIFARRLRLSFYFDRSLLELRLAGIISSLPAASTPGIASSRSNIRS